MNNSTLRTTLLLGALTGLFILIGNIIGGTGGMIIAFIFAVALNMGAWWFSDSIALRFSGAEEADEQTFSGLHRMVEQLAQNANLPKPRVYIINTPMPNAFATGRDPEHGAVAVTTGIMQVLNQDELAGVIAHELAHIKNRDTLISSMAATIGGAITMIAELAFWSSLFGGSDEDNGGGIIGGLLIMILAPIAAVIIQMAISRGREYLADETGARILGDPIPLASALQKIEAYAHGMAQAQGAEQHVNPATSHMYIIPPLSGGLGDLFRTHPQTADRVQRLQALAGDLRRNPA